MASNRIKGITIEIGGDTTGLTDSLKDVESQLSSTQTALRDVNRLLKLDPTNTELLSQKQRLLSEAIQETEVKLEALKQADKQAKKQLESGKLGQDKYDALQREIVETENKLKSLKKESKKVSSTFSETFSEMGSNAKKASEALSPVSKAAAGLAAAAIATVPATEELRTDLARLDNNATDAGVAIDKTREAFEAFNVISDEVDSSVEATANLLQAGFTESNLQKAVEGLAGAYLKFPDTLKIESLADSLQETLATGEATGQFAELLDRLGKSTEDFNAKIQSLTSETDKQNYALQVLADAGLNDTYNQYLKNNEALVDSKQANYEFQESLASLAETLTPLITRVTEFATKVINWFNEMSPAGKNVIMVIIALLAVLAPLLNFIGSISIGLGALIPLIAGLSVPISTVIAVVGIMIAAIVAAIAIFKNWDKIVTTVKNAFSKAGESIRQTAKNIGNGIKNGFNTAVTYITSLKNKAVTWGKDFVQGLINGITSKVSAVVKSVKNIANKIASYLHFSRPDVGPLHYYEEWMPDFMEGLAKGIDKNAYKVNNAVKSLANGIATNTKVYAEPTTNNISVSAPAVTVQVGNKQFDGYIVKTAMQGIRNQQSNILRMKGMA